MPQRNTDRHPRLNIIRMSVIALTGWLLLWQAQPELAAQKADAKDRQALATEAIREALDEAEQARKELRANLQQPGGAFTLLGDPTHWKAHLGAADAALRRARTVLDIAEKVDPKLGKRVEALAVLVRKDESDYLVAMQFDSIRLAKATRFDGAATAAAYPRAFKDLGLPVLEEKPTVVAAEIKASPIHELLVAALDDWAFVADSLGDKKLPEQLLAIARAAQPDPEFGDRVRQIELWRDPKALATLVHDARAAGMSPSLLALVGNLLGRDRALQERWLRKAQARYPADFWLNFQLANALASAQGPEATGFYRAALAIRPNSAMVYNNLGVTLHRQQMLDEATAVFQRAIELDPRFVLPYANLAGVLGDQQKLPEAIAALRRAIQLDPRNAAAHYQLGKALHANKQPAEAVAAYRKAIELDPRFSPAYNGLGLVLADQRKLDEAIASYRRAIELDPRYAEAFHNLGVALTNQKQVREAITAFQRAFDLDAKLPRYAGARAAALAASGQGDEAAKFREQARAWLQADLDRYNVQLKDAEPRVAEQIRQALAGWQTDGALAGVRDAKELARLPEGERNSWHRLWADVAGLLKHAK
jgi:tetratricopeptide (TPR) repeat protein